MCGFFTDMWSNTSVKQCILKPAIFIFIYKKSKKEKQAQSAFRHADCLICSDLLVV